MTEFDIENQPYIQSQYGASPTIKELLNNFRKEIDPETDINKFVSDIMNVETATGYGLDCWARIVGVKREIVIKGTTVDYPVFSFAGSGLYPFNEGVFITFDTLSAQGKHLMNLDDANLRNLILYKAMANITDGSMATLNKLAVALFSSIDFMVTNVVTQGTLSNGDYYNKTPMTIKWVLRANYATNLQSALFAAYAEQATPAGVKYDSAIVSKDPLFGMKSSKLNPFNNGAFGIKQSI